MKPLEGIRIADFTVHAAGPFSTHMLSQLGAECIKVETALRPDIFRKPHAVYGRLGPATFDQVASNKLSVRLNLKHPQGVALAKKLVAVSDVAAESFRAGVIKRLGLGYEELRKVKEDIVMLSVSSSGQAGPDSHFAGYAPLFGAWGGLGYLSGHADGPPMEMRHVMDHSVGMHAALATVAALHKRRRLGKGSHVDVSAREVAASLVGEALVAASAGVDVERIGNADLRRAPQGVYPTKNEDCWISISICDELQWHAFAKLIGDEGLAADSRYSNAKLRRQAQVELDALVEKWTRGMDGNEAVLKLQSSGIPAHLSWRASDIVKDLHIRSRNAIIDVEETDGKQRSAIGFPAQFTQNDQPTITRGTPELGQSEAYVYGELLGLSEGEISSLIEDQAIY